MWIYGISSTRYIGEERWRIGHDLMFLRIIVDNSKFQNLNFHRSKFDYYTLVDELGLQPHPVFHELYFALQELFASKRTVSHNI